MYTINKKEQQLYSCCSFVMIHTVFAIQQILKQKWVLKGEGESRDMLQGHCKSHGSVL